MKIVAKILIFDKDGRVLILYRSHTHPRYAHHPDFPGGEVEQGESSVEAVRREIEEETGLVVNASLINEAHVKTVNDQLTHVVCETTLDDSSPAINLSWEHEGFEWLVLEELQNKTLPAGADDYYLTVLEYIQ